MRIAVTGANGFVGRALCPFLREHLQADLITLTRNPNLTTDLSTIVHKQLGFAASDEALVADLRNIDCLIHLAARAHTHHSTPADFERDNIKLSIRIAQLCVAANIPRLIYISSIKVNGDSTSGRAPFCADDIPQPEDIYGQSKLASEQTLKQQLANTATQLVIIRPPLVYGDHNKGNLQSLEALINARIPLPFGKLENQRDLVSIENLCSLIVLSTSHPNAANEVFLVSDGITRSTKQIVQLLANRKGKSATFFNVPDWIFKLMKRIKPHAIERLTGNLQVNIAKTQSLLGWNPHN